MPLHPTPCTVPPAIQKSSVGASARLGVLDKDQKLLWSRAAGRCSKCKVKLTLDTTEGPTATLGAMAHIIAAEQEGPRGASPLTPDERRRYSNLLLLCSHCHDEIDADVAAYPVEVLHRIKDEHQDWVENKLCAQTLNGDDQIYASVIDKITMALQLDRWQENSTRALNDQMPRGLANAREILLRVQHGTLWPGIHKELEHRFHELASTFFAYADHFLGCALDSGKGIFHEDKSWTESWTSTTYDTGLRRSQTWSRKAYYLFVLYSYSLNAYAEAVRKSVSPMYFLVEGRFLVQDKYQPDAYCMLDQGQVATLLSELNDHAK